MRNADEKTITDAVLERVASAPDERTRRVSEALVKHLHEFIREIEPSVQEWEAGIKFLTRVGHLCDDRRQEFILLSDTLGVSMLVDALNHRQAANATETTVLGPFYVGTAPRLPLGANMSGRFDGMPLFVSGTVSSIDGQPLAAAIVDVWHSDGDGYYDLQKDVSEPSGRARFETGADGRFHFWTVRPSPYPIPNDGPVGEMLSAQGRHPFRPAHVHFMIGAQSYETLVTHIFADGDPYLNSDVVFGVKDSIIAPYRERPPGLASDGSEARTPYATLDYDFVLMPDVTSDVR